MQRLSTATSGVKSVLRAIAVVAYLLCGDNIYAGNVSDTQRIERAVDDVIHPLMVDNNIAGMAIAITVKGQQYLFNYGVADKRSAQKVSNATLFEIGSISKTFTTTLGAYAQVQGKLSLRDKVSQYQPELKGSSFDSISLLDLATYSAGGLPLQFPDEVSDPQSMLAYYKNWRPTYAPGTYRLYSNPSIGLFGHLVANSMGKPFDELVEQQVFPAFGLKHAYIHVPDAQMKNYSYGYNKDDKPIRVTPGVFDAQAYGVKLTAADLLAFVEANMRQTSVADAWQRAIAITHTGYYQIGKMTQGLGWEMYDYPIDLEQLLAGNSRQVIMQANQITRLSSPTSPRAEVLINKTGSTNGFGAYVVFVPAKHLGIVMLANKNYPIPARVTAAYKILTALNGAN
jgi:beta-lactamase class C